MQIAFEWHTTKINHEQKTEVEEELRNKIEHHYAQIVKNPVLNLIVSLYDESPKFLLTGGAVSIEGDKVKEVIRNITYNPGINLEFITNNSTRNV